MRRKLLVALLGANGVLQLVVAGMLLLRAPTAVPLIFGVEYSSETHMITAALGVAVFCSMLLLLTSVVWTAHGERKGVLLGALFGGWSLMAGAVFHFQFASEGAWFDIARGLAILLLAGAELSGGSVVRARGSIA